ncbi:MAG: rubrerythrin [Nitrospirae bacterium GWC2_57_13]|jgi:rubrerythrin|nr:MAG: rubrerythrin [Nitrospirae bacterium GWC1_57_7]OGW27084.1 MAG: rubrerythrin [Nitrospirae bacterium GWC2_57_13]OGW45642.1 MAG: rubrerythrin [Nitrospirae bacterium GWD2_57_8]HAS53273.1 rubrerythrin [Nitrospiraceae bacterium]
MPKTDKDLQDAFAGESQANRKYLAFSKKAEQEGHKRAAKMFRAAAAAETIHAHSHLRELGGIKSTRENLDEAINGESYEFQSMYPAMIEDARSEGRQGALRSFEYANAVEKIHAALYRKVLDSIEKDKGRESEDFHVCQVCGYTVEGEAPDECPVCKSKKQAFMKVE